MENNLQAAQPEETTSAMMQKEATCFVGPRIRLRAILDMMIVGLMIAILLTLSLPVCMVMMK